MSDFTSLKKDFDNCCVASPLPRYKCHKEVFALKIKEIHRAPLTQCADDYESDGWEGGAMIMPDDSRYGAFFVDAAYLRKHKPEVGGYYVVYTDGYKSYSPAKAFEEGYTQV